MYTITLNHSQVVTLINALSTSLTVIWNEDETGTVILSQYEVEELSQANIRNNEINYQLECFRENIRLGF